MNKNIAGPYEIDHETAMPVTTRKSKDAPLIHWLHTLRKKAHFTVESGAKAKKIRTLCRQYGGKAYICVKEGMASGVKAKDLLVPWDVWILQPLEGRGRILSQAEDEDFIKYPTIDEVWIRLQKLCNLTKDNAEPKVRAAVQHTYSEIQTMMYTRKNKRKYAKKKSGKTLGRAANL